ncbi:MAG: DUF4157 domain-containing protein [Myxococcales bacterium]|nr:DUF4157 domain-containing protein [Myxococcales bacterium]
MRAPRVSSDAKSPNAAAPAPARGPSPEQTTMQQLADASAPVQRVMALQRAADSSVANTRPQAVRDAARAGLGGPAGELPHQQRIQRSFGSHRIDHVRAHTHAKAAAASRSIGAQAYTLGSSVAFASAQPSLHTAAHEAAHVVQQRAGIHLSGGVGESGDPHERHADAVADAVVAGRSAEGLLDRYAAGSGGGEEVVQRKVGLEFQTVGGNWNLMELTQDENGRPKLSKPGHAEVTLRQPIGGWRLENDSSDLEYITDAFDETDAGIGQLRQAAQAAADYHGELLTQDGARAKGWSDRVEGKMGKEIDGTTYVLNLNGQRNAHPQATAGLRLDKLRIFATNWAEKSKSDEESPWKTMGWRDLKYNRGDHGPDDLRQAFLSANSVVPDDLSDAAKSFLFLIYSYALGSAVVGVTPNAKNATPLMSRTNFAALLVQLSEDDVRRVLNLLPPNPDAAFVEQEDKRLMLSEWWAALVAEQDPKDILESLDPNGTRTFHGLSDTSSMGVGDNPADIGMNRNGAIVELRELGDEVPPERWGAIAEAVGMAVKETNEV